jgi:ABC-2 type transport system permease protein
MTHALRIARQSAWVNFQEVARNGFLLFAAVWQPFFIGVTTMYVLRHRPDFDPMYVIVGTALSGIWSTLLFAGSGAINHERWTGTLELLAASPAPFFAVIGGKLAGTTMFSLVSLILSYGIGALLFGYPVAIAQPVPFALSGFLFPVLLLPIWLLPISSVLPPYWAAFALHGTASGELDLGGLLRAWVFLLLTGGVLLLLASRLLDEVLTRARRAGTLALS